MRNYQNSYLGFLIRLALVLGATVLAFHLIQRHFLR